MNTTMIVTLNPNNEEILESLEQDVETSFFVSETSALRKGEEAFCVGKLLPRMKEEAAKIAKACNSEITVKDYGDDYYGIFVNKLYEERNAKRVRKRVSKKLA